MSEVLTGTVIGNYEVGAPIGDGGSSVVYRVRHTTLGTIFAMKVLRGELCNLEDRMLQEGRMQASLRHPNIVAVTDVLNVGGRPALVLEYVDGPTLKGWLATARPSLDAIEDVFRGIVAGVSRVHAEGLVHRDLKPSNVLLQIDPDGHPIAKLVDFTLAKVLEKPGMTLTSEAGTLGTPGYMAPEQFADPSGVDCRADMFSLGCILYEMCTGSHPFLRDSLHATVHASANATYTPLDSMAPGLPARLKLAIEGCLVTDPDQRIPDCRALTYLLDGHALSGFAHRPPSEQPLERNWRRLRYLLAISVGVALGSTLFGTLLAVIAAVRVTGQRLAEVEAPADEVPSAEVSSSSLEEEGTRDLVVVEQVLEPMPPQEVVSAPMPAPASAPAPAAVPEPVPAPVPERPPVVSRPSPTGRVSTTAQVHQIFLVGPDGPVSLGDVPPGRYRIMVAFDAGDSARVAGSVDVRQGSWVALECQRAFQICRVL
ncbi:MAG: serine/threonine protein kinase [Myxococcales bacterium]|nr:serine/threonine protein kinase [Myxococcales bacterium]